MVVKFQNSAELLQNAESERLYGKLVAQLKKDFGLANIAMDFSPGRGGALVSPEILTTLLHEKIYVLILERFEAYLNLLYIIDVPEREVKKIQVLDAVEVAKQVTFLVLKREWQKVWWRNH